MKRTVLIHGFLVFLLAFIPGEETETFLFERSPGEKTIQLGGSLDASHARFYPFEYPAHRPEISIRISNRGENEVRGIRLVVNGEKNWYDFDSWWKEITDGAKTDLEKALAVFWFFSFHNRHNCSHPGYIAPVEYINSFGFECCFQAADLLRVLFNKKGIPYTRLGAIGHSVSEYLVDGSERLLDTDIKVYYLDRDNREPVGIVEASRDPYLIKRVPHYFQRDSDYSYDPLVSHWGLPRKVAALYKKNCSKAAPVLVTKRPMKKINLTLRKGESFEYRYQKPQRPGIFKSKDEKTNGFFSETLLNGILETSLDFTKEKYDYPRFQNLASLKNRGLSHQDPSQKAEISLPIDSPWPVLGMDVMIEGSFSEGLSLEIRSKKGNKQISLQPNRWIGCDPQLAGLYPARSLDLTFQFNPAKGEKGREVPVLEKIRLKTFVQLARISVPELRIGENRILYSDTSKKRRIELQFVYEPISDLIPPRAPRKALYPKDGALVNDSRIRFSWSPSLDPKGGIVTDYRFQLSSRRDMLYPLSPNFDRLMSNTLSRGGPYYILPFPGLLHPGETYYWRVQSKNDRGLVSDWSPVWEFTPEFPGYPQNVGYEIRGGEIFLVWEQSTQGTPPHFYEIYGSDEYGFIPSKSPQILEGFAKSEKPVKKWGDYKVTDWRAVHDNFLARVPPDTREIKLVSPEPARPNMNRLYYRVTAVGKWGSESAPSRFVTLPEGFIHSPSIVEWEKSEDFLYRIRFLDYMGQVTSKGNYFAGLWDQPEYKYAASDLPPGLELNPENGMISGRPEIAPGENRFSFLAFILKNGSRISSRRITVRILSPE